MIRSVFCWIAPVILSCAALEFGTAQDDELVSVTARDIKLEVPKSWKQVESTSAMRAAEFSIPAADTEGEAAELVVYYFGGPTGGTRANVQRWIDQFYEDGRSHEIFGGKCRDGEYVLVSIAGTYKKPEGPPAAQQTIDKPGSRVVGVVLTAERDAGKEYYFLKFSGPEALVTAQLAALHKSFGAEEGSEKKLGLDDLAD